MSRSLTIVLFKTLVMIVILALQYYLLRKVLLQLGKAEQWRWRRIVTCTIFAIFNIPFAILIFWRPSLTHIPGWFLSIGIYPFYIWHFSSFITAFILLIGETINLLSRCVQWFISKVRHKENKEVTSLSKDSGASYQQNRRTFLQQGMTVLSAATFGTAIYGTIKHDEYEVTPISIPIKNLPLPFQGFTIALLSDIHSSIFMQKEEMKRYAELVNSLQCDVITVTGDFVNSMTEEVYPMAEAFADLKAPYGVYGVLGNHDYFTNNIDLVAQEINQCGIKLLRHERVALEKDNTKLYLLGADDLNNLVKAGRVFGTLTEGIAEGIPKILMVHRPYGFTKAAEYNIDLSLCGHTHGGQVVFGKIGTNIIAPARIASPYVAGLYTIGSAQMYVSRGIGTVGVPIRVNCPPEVTKITLVKA